MVSKHHEKIDDETIVEAIEHDPQVLPHMHLEDVIDKYLPLVSSEDPEWIELEPDARRIWVPINHRPAGAAHR